MSKNVQVLFIRNFTEDNTLIFAFGHILILHILILVNIKLIFSLLNMRVQAMVF